MANAGFGFNVVKKGSWSAVKKFFEKEEIKKRVHVFKKNTLAGIAVDFKDRVKGKIPKTPYYKYYSTSLDVGDVDEDSVVVFSNTQKASINKLDPSRYVLYFYKDKKMKGSKFDQFLIDNSPWVLGVVKKYSGKIGIYYRRVSKDEVNVTRVKNVDVERNLVTLMSKRGLIDVEYADEDVGFAALRLEFGFRGYRHKPIWRPELRNINFKAVASKNLDAMNPIKKEKEVKLVKFTEKQDDYFAKRILGG